MRIGVVCVNAQCASARALSFNACAVPHFLLPGNIDFVVMSVWSQNETLALVELWRDESVHRNLAVYTRLAELLSIRGYERTGKQLL